MTSDEMKLVNFITYSFQKVVKSIKSIESIYTNKFKYQMLSKIVRVLSC
jgi:hypothetical protein